MAHPLTLTPALDDSTASLPLSLLSRIHQQADHLADRVAALDSSKLIEVGREAAHAFIARQSYRHGEPLALVNMSLPHSDTALDKHNTLLEAQSSRSSQEAIRGEHGERRGRHVNTLAHGTRLEDADPFLQDLSLCSYSAMLHFLETHPDFETSAFTFKSSSTVSQLRSVLGREPRTHEVSDALGLALADYESRLLSACGSHFLFIKEVMPHTAQETPFTPYAPLMKALFAADQPLFEQLITLISRLPTLEHQVLVLCNQQHLSFSKAAFLLDLQEDEIALLHVHAMTRLRSLILELRSKR